MPSRVIEKTLLLIMILAILQVAARSAVAESDDTGGTYIDLAIVQNQIRFRFDAASDNPFPDRAEFFYPKCGCFTGGNGPGPALPESRVDYQELRADIEYVLFPGLSAFTELPIRFINPEVNENHTGLGDIRAGFKYALLEETDRFLTLQLRGYFPTGDGDKGLGTEHVSLEPGLLFQRNDGRLRTFGEFRAWIPISSEKERFPNPAPGSTDPLRNFAGTVLRYGLGASYDLYQQCCTYPCSDCGVCHSYVKNRLSFVSELVGWTVLDGLKFRTSNPAAPTDAAFFTFDSAAGDTIVNLKLGLRWSRPNDSFGVGYGFALTDEVWYQNIVRVEYAYRY